MQGISVNDTEVIGDQWTVAFDHPIDEFLKFDDLIVVRLKLTGEDFPDKHQNIIGIEKGGNIRWKIQKAPEEGHYDSYAGIYDDEGELRAYNLCGMNYRVDKESGEVSDGKFVK